MEGHSYISCIKINGVPILPPMMTEDVREEMSNYKQIAINIERKLAALHAAKQYNRDTETFKSRCKDLQVEKDLYDSKENLVPSECKGFGSNETNIRTMHGISPETSESSSENVDKILQWTETINLEYKPECQTNQASDNISRSESTSTSLNADSCLSETNLTRSDTTEMKTEIWKPQVPKTLNIVPLTLNSPNCVENEKYHENGLSSIENTPKLIRQGSYILDTPSPILLAQMQMEMTSSTCTPCSDYVPTSHTNTVRRKEWNIAQAKIEWEDELKSKEFVPAESSGLLPKQKETNRPNAARKIRKSISLQAKPKFSYEACSSTRSVDCIQTMLANESTRKNSVQVNRNSKFAVESNSEKKHKNQKWKKYDSLSTLNSACKRGNSLENITNVDAQFPKCVQNKPNRNSGDNFTNEASRDSEAESSLYKLKSSITSDKLLTIYKRVQEMHKKQMAELLFRQQREQTLLQKEFEKQQLILLTEIRKSFPGMSAPLQPENVLCTAFNQADDGKLLEAVDHSAQNIKNMNGNLQQESESCPLQDNNTRTISCPLDYIYPETELLPKVNDPVTLSDRETTETPLDNARTHEREAMEEDSRSKRLSVSRELFPLDCRTTHVPIIDRAIYGAKHIEAVNVINAYTRGYLVRRMMQTQRVIALKNTYKEALHCMLKLHVDAPLNRSEFNFLHRLQLQCDAASMNIVELFAQSPKKRMQVIAQDREIKQSRIERPTSARSYSFATQRTLARKKLKEMEEPQPSSFARSCLSRSRCQTWTSDVKEKLISPNILYHSIKRSTSAGTVRKPWR